MGFIVVGRAWVMEEVRLEDKLYLQHITSCVGLVLIILHFSAGAYGGSESGMYSSGYGGDYMSRGSDVCFCITYLYALCC